MPRLIMACTSQRLSDGQYVLLYESQVRRHVLESPYHMHMLSPPHPVADVSIIQLGMQRPVSECHMHSSSPSQLNLSVQRNWQIFAQLTLFGRHVHIDCAVQTAEVVRSVHVILHSGTPLSHMQRATASHVDWVVYETVQVLSQYVPFQLQNWSALQSALMLAMVASGTVA